MTADLAKYMDHTLLKPDATLEQIEALVQEAKTYRFASVCVNPHWVPLCSELLKDSETKVCTVIGFPLGAASSRVKAFETKQAILDGASEIDMVMNIGELKSERNAYVQDDIEMVVEAASGKALVKVIIETALLTNEEIIRASKLAEAAGADFVKTSTGFSGGGATVKDIRLIRDSISPAMKIKASGGVRDAKTALDMIEAGAHRIGASSSVAIVTGAKGDSLY